jgi:hypothetical protein
MFELSSKSFVGTPVISLDLFKNTPSDFSLANRQVAWDTWTKGPSKNCANKPQDSGKTANGPLAHRLHDELDDYISLFEQPSIPDSESETNKGRTFKRNPSFNSYN